MTMFKTNSVYCGDCQKVLFNHFPEKSVDLIYVDPPFFSNKTYEVIWGDGYELRAFEDRWKGGIENYISWMEPKVRECHRVLKDTGSMYLHCDWHANSHLRILMDEVFSAITFQNEIIWEYGVGGVSKTRWARKHDNILFYSKSKEFKFNVDAVREPYKEKCKVLYKIVKGKKYLRKNPLGRVPHDVWDIPSLTNTAKERLGYPTQKPETLLERIIKASSNPTDIVLDPMCGCGTAIAAAYKLDRRYIGVDVSPTACKLMLKRMHKVSPTNIPYNEKDIIGLPRTAEEIKTMQPFEFQNWVLEKMNGRANPKKTADMGIDGWIPMEGNAPVQVKQSESVGRNVVDNFETAMRRTDKTKGYIIAYSFTKGAYEEVARVANKSNLMIELKTLDNLLEEE